jgi:hypothetical protein
VDGGGGAGTEGRVDLGRLLEHIVDDGLSRLEERGEALHLSATIHCTFIKPLTASYTAFACFTTTRSWVGVLKG